MAAIAYLRPPCSRAGTERLLADVERAIAAGIDLGDRREAMRDVTRDLRRNHALLRSAIEDLTRLGAALDPESARLVALIEARGRDVLGYLGPLVGQAARADARSTDRRAGEPPPATST